MRCKIRDSHGIQTHNLLIRSQMLYSVELGSQVEQLRGLLGDGDLYFGGGAAFFLLDAGLLAGEAAEVIDPCATDFTDLVEFNRVDLW